MTYLAMVFTTEWNMMMIVCAQTDKWPSGLVWKLVKELLEKYKPNKNMAQVEVLMMLSNVSMENDYIQAYCFSRSVKFRIDSD